MKKISLYVLVFLLIGPSLVYGHTALEESNPEDGTVVEEPVEELELVFTTELEEQSTIELTSEGETIPVTVSTEENILTASLAEPLSDGSYTAEWVVVGEDGHPVEGAFDFEVSGVDEELEEAVIEDNEETEESEPAAEEVAGTEESAGQDVSAEEESTSLGWIAVLLVVLAVLAIAGIWLAKRRK